jgi:hypothetical protein
MSTSLAEEGITLGIEKEYVLAMLNGECPIQVFGTDFQEWVSMHLQFPAWHQHSARRTAATKNPLLKAISCTAQFDLRQYLYTKARKRKFNENRQKQENICRKTNTEDRHTGEHFTEYRQTHGDTWKHVSK